MAGKSQLLPVIQLKTDCLLLICNIFKHPIDSQPGGFTVNHLSPYVNFQQFCYIGQAGIILFLQEGNWAQSISDLSSDVNSAL